MRKYMTEIMQAFHEGRTLTRPSASTDGINVYSYGTILVQKLNGTVVYNATKYSPTTTNQQTAVRYHLRGEDYQTVTDIPMGQKSLPLAKESLDIC